MLKIVPDPPGSGRFTDEPRPSRNLPAHSPRPTTAHAHFGTCHEAHPPMFSVHAGIDGEDALVCAVAALQAA
jgi:hypothetical protein